MFIIHGLDTSSYNLWVFHHFHCLLNSTLIFEIANFSLSITCDREGFSISKLKLCILSMFSLPSPVPQSLFFFNRCDCVDSISSFFPLFMNFLLKFVNEPPCRIAIKVYLIPHQNLLVPPPHPPTRFSKKCIDEEIERIKRFN